MVPSTILWQRPANSGIRTTGNNFSRVDRILVRRTMGYSAFEMVYGRECTILPVQPSVASWNIIDWELVNTREDLILVQMQQLDQHTLAQH